MLALALNLALLGHALQANTAEDDFLTIGAKAAPLDIAHWLRGEEIRDFEHGHVYLLEFWDTNCGPCIGNMPHLSQIQKKYGEREVHVIGVSNEPLSMVVDFLVRPNRETGEPYSSLIEYSLATDPDRSTHDTYFEPAGMRGVPAVFIIGKDGRIEWLGHPKDVDPVLEAVVTDQWDRNAHIESTRARQERTKKIRDAKRLFQSHYKAKNWEAAIGALEDVLRLDPHDSPSQVTKFFYLASDEFLGDPDRALEFVHTFLEEHWDKASILSHWAWRLAADERIEKTDLELALRAGERALELEPEDPFAMETLATVHAKRGEMDEAIKWQANGIDHLDPQSKGYERWRKEFTERLEAYKKK